MTKYKSRSNSIFPRAGTVKICFRFISFSGADPAFNINIIGIVFGTRCRIMDGYLVKAGSGSNLRIFKFLPLAHKAMKVWACLCTIVVSNETFSKGSRLKMCLKKSWGVTDDTSHFNLLNTKSSHL